MGNCLALMSGTDKELRGKTAVITGASRGIGRACAFVFAEQGANIVFTYNKSKDAADRLVKELEGFGVGCVAIQADVRDYNKCRVVVEESIKNFNKLDIVVNNAGIVKDAALVMMKLEGWHDVIETNLGGCFNMSRAAIVTLLKQKSGCIVNISSIAGLVGVARQTNYSAAKAGIIGFSKALAKEAGPYNVRVNVVCPGYIQTDMVESVPEKFRRELLENIPMKRLGRPEEVAQVCLFLASERASYITGKVVQIDGGLAI